MEVETVLQLKGNNYELTLLDTIHCTVMYCTMLYCIYSTVLYYTVMYCTLHITHIS